MLCLPAPVPCAWVGLGLLGPGVWPMISSRVTQIPGCPPLPRPSTHPHPPTPHPRPRPEAQVPASERHGALVGEAWPLAPELPPTSLPGSWAAPRPSGLHQIADVAFLHPLPARGLQQGPWGNEKACQPERLMQMGPGRGNLSRRGRSHGFVLFQPAVHWQCLHCAGPQYPHLANYAADFLSF